MATEFVEQLQQAYDRLNAGVSGDDLLEVLRQGCHDDLVVEMGVLEGTFHGPEGFKEFIEGQRAIIDDLRAEPEEFIEAGDRMIVPFRLSGRARNMHVPVEYHYVHVWTVRDGKASHLRLYADKEKAFRDAGVSG